MSEQKHTAEPDVPDAEHYKCQLCNGTGSLDSDMNPFDAAMWNRTAACVNAMKGIADPAAAMVRCREAAATIATQAAEIARLTAHLPRALESASRPADAGKGNPAPPPAAEQASDQGADDMSNLAKIAEVLRSLADNTVTGLPTFCWACGQQDWVQPCRKCLRIAADALDAAGRLPRTKDGVIVVPGMDLWTNDTMSCFPQECKMPHSAVGGDINGGYGVSNYDPTRCYSTRARALAEAAAKETQHGQA